MRRKDCSPLRDEDGSISLENRIRGMLQFGPSWYSEMQAQDEAFARLNKSLGREHVAIMNVTLPGFALTIPMILLSPQGVRVIIPSRMKGVYRAKGEEWLKFGGGRSRRFSTARPNLQTRVTSMAQELFNFLRDRGYEIPEVEPVLVFTNPRTHVDSLNARVHIVLADAIDHFAANLQQFHPIMDQEDIRDLSELLTNPEAALEAEAQAAAAPEQPAPRPDAPIDLPEPTAAEKDVLTAEQAPALVPRRPRSIRKGPLALSRRQWILLGTMAFLELLVLGIFLIYFLAYSVY